MLKKLSWAFTGGLVLVSVMLCVVVAVAFLDGIRNLGAGLFLLALGLFFVAKGVLLWFLRQRAQRPAEIPGVLADRQWQLVSAGYFVSAACFLLSAILGHEKLWSWAGVVASFALGWTYFVISRKHEIA